MYKGQKVSVVIPAYNEEKGITSVVKDFKKKYVDEVIVVDNNCTDNTSALARKAGAKVVKQPKQGYGNAIMKGLEVAKGDLIFVTESDSTFYGDDMLILLKHINEGDIIVGTRTNLDYVEKGAKMDWFLNWGNRFIAMLVNIEFLGKVWLTDVGCTFRVIKRPALKKILNKLKAGGSTFSPHMLVVALDNGLKVKEYPVRYRSRIGESKITSNKIKSFKVGLGMIKTIIFR
jgi:glycosyltransferase involved in cell wall biosynthesis